MISTLSMIGIWYKVQLWIPIFVSYTELKKDVLDVGKKTFINGKEGKVISSEPLLGKYKVLIDDEIIEIDINDSKK